MNNFFSYLKLLKLPLKLHISFHEASRVLEVKFILIFKTRKKNAFFRIFSELSQIFVKIRFLQIPKPHPLPVSTSFHKKY